MNGYFDQVQREIGAAVSSGRHLPWHARLRYPGRARALVVLFAALAIATPAVGAVTNWFGFGKPFTFPRSSNGRDAALSSTSRLLSLRVPDPQGGPPWGLLVAHTIDHDACLVFGRVEDGRLGSLGIDSAWSDDNKFHAFQFPRKFSSGWGQDCGTTDEAGNAFLNVEWESIASSANPSLDVRGPEGASCETAQYEPSRLRAAAADGYVRTGAGTCPPGTSRIVFMGLLGPDATSITYQAADGSLQTEPTSGSDGAYLLVFALTQKTCNLYFQSALRAHGPCGGGVESTSDSYSPNVPGTVRAIHYRDGHSCSLVPPAGLVSRFTAVIRRIFPAHGAGGSLVSPRVQAELERVRARFAASEHLSVTELDDKLAGVCPPVGYVAPKAKQLTAADVASPITVDRIRRGAMNTGASISFTARQPVRSDDSWYEFATTGPPRCEAESDGPVNYGNVHAGQRLTSQIDVSANCRGTVRGVVGYMQNGGPTDAETAGSGGTPGKDGSIVVGRFKFTIR